jgi:hypothetical protein
MVSSRHVMTRNSAGRGNHMDIDSDGSTLMAWAIYLIHITQIGLRVEGISSGFPVGGVCKPLIAITVMESIQSPLPISVLNM